MIEISGIKKSYKMGDNVVDALRDVTLTIEDGDFVAIMGPSGSGKSTLMHILGLLDVPTSGSYKLHGREVSKLSEDELAILRRDEIGFIFQQFNLLPRMPAWQNVSLPLLYSEKKFDFSKAEVLLEKVGLGTRGDHKPNELSGGQQQRVAIARSLINNPRIIFADEPTGNLDSRSEKEIMDILKSLNAQGITVVIVTHEEEIGEQANRLIRMRDGVVQSDERKAPLNTVASHTSDQSLHTEFHFGEMIEHFDQGWKTLAANKVRSGLSMLGILIGVAAVVTMLALGTGAQQSIEKQLASMGSNLLILRAGNVRVSGVAQESGVRIRITTDDVAALKAQIPSIKNVVPNVSGRGQVTYLNKNWNTSVAGVSTAFVEVRNAEPVMGRFFSDDENQRRALVAVIGRTVSRELFGDKSPIGESIKINKINFTVIGMLPEKGAQGPNDQDDRIIVPVQTAMYRLFGKTYVDSVDVEVGQKELIDETQDSLKEVLNKRHRVPLSQQDDAFQIFNMADLQAAIESSSKTMSMLLSSIAAISLLVGGIGIMNIMLVSVTERTREIGLRKAIGGRKIDILMQFLAESVVVSVIGGLLGIGLAWGVTIALSSVLGWPMSISAKAVGLSFFFSAFIGIVFGLYPAKKASELHPIDALRYE
ncbi:ABC transporter permease [Bdellovibrio sp. SKB1291214]|uniref:ABC transporter permease n=1 Tax=Bdellovibrio sp. SKB1291214 TaxID=1732569 RepID=UPI000B51574A|nr:ABC transporter permease [Bdellovibrio sp. SKB1291214]UYL09379.1 ABC transporter permease [Bdellovibrio sp. SKB1291214]